MVGATGYSGMELTHLLTRHPCVESLQLYSSPHPSGAAGQSGLRASSNSEFPVQTLLGRSIAPFDAEDLKSGNPNVVFFATPNETSNELLPEFKSQPFRIIDLSGSFRLPSTSFYPRWYGFEHAAPEMLRHFVYGLPELNKARIASATRVANPGCYATSILLPLLPLAKGGWIDETSPIVCDSKSGVSGAGKQPTANTHFCEVSESFKAYSVFSHRHLPEIEFYSGLNGGHKLIFTPHLLPINRGILSTIYLKLKRAASEEAIRDVYRKFYSRAPFVRIFPSGELPQVKWVAHTNYCDIGIRVERNTPWAVLISCIDNLVKGAAGQALQNMNLMFGLEETTGLN